MTPEQFAAVMREIEKRGDPEMAHVEADDAICALLRELGFEDAVAVFERMDKWYA